MKRCNLGQKSSHSRLIARLIQWSSRASHIMFKVFAWTSSAGRHLRFVPVASTVTRTSKSKIYPPFFTLCCINRPTKFLPSSVRNAILLLVFFVLEGYYFTVVFSLRAPQSGMRRSLQVCIQADGGQMNCRGSKGHSVYSQSRGFSWQNGVATKTPNLSCALSAVGRRSEGSVPIHQRQSWTRSSP